LRDLTRAAGLPTCLCPGYGSVAVLVLALAEEVAEHAAEMLASLLGDGR
jgi:hypothetical protein